MADDGVVRLFARDIAPEQNSDSAEESYAEYRGVLARVSQILCSHNPCYCGAEKTASSSSNTAIEEDEKQGKTESGSVSQYVKKKGDALRRRVSINDLPTPYLDGFPTLQNIIQKHGIKPEFLYRKWIERSDVSRVLNRLLMTKSEKLMSFVTGEGRRKMMANEGIQVCGYDSEGRGYMFHITKWTSFGQPVINRGSWKEAVNNNNVEEGQMIEIWGGRRNPDEEPVLIINFRKEAAREEDDDDQSNAGSSIGTEEMADAHEFK